LRRVLPALLVVAWLGIGGVGGTYQGKLGDVETNDNAAFLPASAEATEVARLRETFAEQELLPAIVVFERDGGLTDADRAFAAARGEAAKGLAEQVSPPIPSEDGRALQLVVALDGADEEGSVEAVGTLRDAARQDRPEGLTVHVTGPAALVADLGEAFGGIDGLLLIVTAVAVALILLVVYRSPLLPLVVLVSAAFALCLAVLLVYQLAAADVIALNGQSRGILFILVFGAATDYALLLVSRYREELYRERSSWTAMWRALRASVAPITASAGTVIAGLLCLLFSDLNSNRGLGPVAAIGIAASLLACLTFLPAVLVLLGRSAFWPFRPKAGDERHTGEHGVWHRVADAVRAKPRRTWVITTIALLIAVAFLPQFRASGTAQTDTFLGDVDSVAGQEVLGEHFPGGSGSPAVIIAAAGSARGVADAARAVDGVAEVRFTGSPEQPKVVDGRVELSATLTDAADSPAAVDTVRALREAVRAVPGSDAKVGGPTATQLDTQTTATRDLGVIIPIVLAVIFLILALLLRALVAPLVLIGTVVLSFAATLGLSALVFNHVLGFPGADPSVPLFAFVFLVALGVDYNIFLVTRVREEALTHGTAEGTSRALTVTGGVITSAGVVLAATFSALAVLPILFLAQIAFLVAFGVLLDTLVVRSLLVPALITDIGRRTWLPSALGRRSTATQPRRGAERETTRTG
jgi:RND superfamily putative drug exporter